MRQPTREEFVAASYPELKKLHGHLSDTFKRPEYNTVWGLEAIMYEEGQQAVINVIGQWLLQYENTQQDKVLPNV